MKQNITPDELTPQQNKAFDDAVALLSEHFEAIVLSAETEPHLSNRDNQVAIRRMFRQGGYTRNLGMLLACQHEMLHKPSDDEEA